MRVAGASGRDVPSEGAQASRRGVLGQAIKIALKPTLTVGQKAEREIAEAIDGRAKFGDGWRAPEDSVLPRAFLEGSLHDLKLAQAGRPDLMDEPASRRSLEMLDRSARYSRAAKGPDDGMDDLRRLSSRMEASAGR